MGGVHRSGSGPCLMVGFGIGGAEPSHSATIEPGSIILQNVKLTKQICYWSIKNYLHLQVCIQLSSVSINSITVTFQVMVFWVVMPHSNVVG